MDRKFAFEDDKNIEMKKWQNLHFGGKFELFFILFFFRSNTPKNVKREVENLLLYDKIVKYHRSGKILIFAKGLVHGFGPKFEIFSFSVFLDQKSPLKVSWCSRQKISLLRC